MTLDKLIAEQAERFKSLEKELRRREDAVQDLERPRALKHARVDTLRTTLAGLERGREAAVARFDAEIAARRAELAALEERSDLDLALGEVQKTGRSGQPAARQTAAATAKPARTKGARTARSKVAGSKAAGSKTGSGRSRGRRS